MNIAILAAGAGDMYCGSCLRDVGMAAGLKQLGHQVSLIPLYTPLKADTDTGDACEVFYGGVNVYLQHQNALFRHTPRAMDWLLDRGWLLRWAGNLGAQTTPDQVAGLTADIIQGSDGSTRKELHRLIEFLRTDVKPDIVSLPNLMFIGLAGAIHEKLNIPVVCELTGEDIFLDQMSADHRGKLREMIGERAADVTRFISATAYYADQMAAYLNISRDRIDVVSTGIAADLLAPLPPRDDAGSKPAVVGYLARICPEKGLDRLIDAMLLIKQMPGHAAVRLVAAGYLGARDRKWFDSLRNRIDSSLLADSFTFAGTVSREEKIKMLDSIDVMSVPTAYPEAKGIYILEALARGVPVVQPAHGSFPELIHATQGGVLVPPNDPRALAETLAGLVSDRPQRRQLGIAGRAAIESKWREEQMAGKLVEIYQALR